MADIDKALPNVKTEIRVPGEEEVEVAKPHPKLVRQKSSVVEPQPVYHPQHQPAPVNNYYYYGAPPVGPQHHYESEGGWLPPKDKAAVAVPDPADSCTAVFKSPSNLVPVIPCPDCSPTKVLSVPVETNLPARNPTAVF